MAKRIITISREFGSGGRFIGEEVAKELGIAYYNDSAQKTPAVRENVRGSIIHPSFAQETSSDVSGGEECAETHPLTSCPFFFFV